MKKFAAFMAAGALVGALGFTFIKVQEFSDVEHERFQTALWQLKHQDTAFNEGVLKARFALLDDYDSFLSQGTEMRSCLATLGRTPAFIDATGKAGIDRARAEYAVSLQAREKLLERFKSRNATLANSRRYLPVALEELSARASRDPAGRGLESAVNDLARLTLSRLTSAEDAPADAQAGMQRLVQWCTQNPDHPEAAFAASLLRHVRVITEGQSEVDALTRSLLALPTDISIRSLFETYQASVAKALGRSAQYRTLFYMLGAAMLLGVIFCFLALRSANRQLEARVWSRTAELEAEISERKIAEQKLKESLRSLAAINAVLDRACIIACTDQRGTITYANDNLCRISEYSREELIGQNHRILKSDEHPHSFFVAMWKAIARGEIWRGEIKNVTKSGRVYWVDTTIGPLHDEEGKPNGYMAIRTDVTERKRVEAEVAEINKRLIDTSRQAGMAEVATGVLHNVGNVLNSVNVSATLITDQLKKSRMPDVARVVALLREHSGNLAGFLATDPKGQKVPAFLEQVAVRLGEEQRQYLEELDSLRKNIEHIKEIVTMQQSYASVSGVTEVIRVPELVEDTLRMNATAFDRHEVQILRDFQEVPPINTEKHKILQILINLLRNAKYACDDSGRSDRQIAVRVAQGCGRITISVSDNGVGIPQENLLRIFNHGFTTRKTGHGFGLHSGALAAKELGGELRAHSDGPGMGATFTLELPCQRN
jgi:PAS domain S-box-containing protein